MSVVTNDQIIDAYIIWKSHQGWRITFRSGSGVQFTKPKQWNKLGIYTGLLTLPVYGIGLIFWLLTLFDYLLAKDKTIFVSVSRMETELRARRS